MSSDNSKEEQKSPHPLPVTSSDAQREMSLITAQHESESLCLQNFRGDDIAPRHSNQSSLLAEENLQKGDHSIDLNRTENQSHQEIQDIQIQTTFTKLAKLKNKINVHRPELEPIPSASITNINSQTLYKSKSIRNAHTLPDEHKKTKCNYCAYIVMSIWIVGSCLTGGIITYVKTKNAVITTIATIISLIIGIVLGALTNYGIKQCCDRNNESVDANISSNQI